MYYTITLRKNMGELDDDGKSTLTGEMKVKAKMTLLLISVPFRYIYI